MLLSRHTRRRAFIAALGGAAAWPVVGRAQHPGKLPTIGFLDGDASVWDPWKAAFVDRLRQLGWIEGRTIAIEYRWAEARPERVAELRQSSSGSRSMSSSRLAPAATSVKQATSDIPIVFAIGNDPIGTGLIASLARPGGNVTGLSIQASDLAGKRLEILREIVPGLRRLAIMADVGDPDGVREMGEVQNSRAHARH